MRETAGNSGRAGMSALFVVVAMCLDAFICEFLCSLLSPCDHKSVLIWEQQNW